MKQIIENIFLFYIDLFNVLSKNTKSI